MARARRNRDGSYPVEPFIIESHRKDNVTIIPATSLRKSQRAVHVAGAANPLQVPREELTRKLNDTAKRCV